MYEDARPYGESCSDALIAARDSQIRGRKALAAGRNRPIRDGDPLELDGDMLEAGRDQLIPDSVPQTLDRDLQKPDSDQLERGRYMQVVAREMLIADWGK